MTNPMTAEEARKIADSFPGNWNHYEQTRIRVGLRAYADMLDRQTVDREAIDEIVCEAYFKGVSVGKNVSNAFSFTPLTDRILALMPAAPVAAKELEWRGDNAANTPFGLYWVVPVSPRNPDGEWLFTAPITATTDMYPTREAAKAAAQAHYNDAISKAVRPAPVTDGMVMVPREPTEAMIVAGEYVTPAVIWEQVRAIYRAMIEAATGGK